MADPARLDARVAERYRALATEEPSVVLDAAIRASARRAVGAGPGGRGTSRWAFPVSVAAVLVLAFGVTLHLQREQPGIESSFPDREVVAPKAAPGPAPSPAPQVVPPPPRRDAAPQVMAFPGAMPASPPAAKADAPDMARAAPGKIAAAAEPMPERKTEAFAAPAARDMNVGRPSEAPAAIVKEKLAALVPAPAAAGMAIRPESTPLAPAAAPPTLQAAEAARSRAAPETPERKLERIAEMRRAGRHAEADEALARFRREHPEFRISAETLERVKAP